MPIVSDLARRKKLEYFLPRLPKGAAILEAGCGDGWFVQRARELGWRNVRGLDVVPPADIVGDIRSWRSLSIAPESYDAIVAFELVEHVDCFDDLYAILKPGGMLMLTSPVPSRDWICRWLERFRLTQSRTSPHAFLVDFRTITRFTPVEVRVRGAVSQWGLFVKTDAPAQGSDARPRSPAKPWTSG